MDRSLIENDKNFCIKYTIDDVYFKEIDKILIDYISRHNKKFCFYLISCKLIIKSDDDFTENIETYYYYQYTDIKNIIRDSKYIIYNVIPKAISYLYSFCNIKDMNLYTINERCNMTYEYYIKQPMPMVERWISFNIAKNPTLINSLNRNKKHPLIGNYSHI